MGLGWRAADRPSPNGPLWWHRGHNGNTTTFGVTITQMENNYPVPRPHVLRDEPWEEIAIWCQANCMADFWRLPGGVGFESEADAVLFYVSKS